MNPRTVHWRLSEEDTQRVDHLLRSLLRETSAQRALLIDRNGQVIASAGERPELDSTTFASLASADFLANDQLASLLGEQEFSSLFHQGERESMCLLDVARRALLAVLFDDRAPLGLVRIRAKQTVRELQELFARLDGAIVGAAPPGLEAGWASEASNQIDHLFGGS